MRARLARRTAVTILQSPVRIAPFQGQTLYCLGDLHQLQDGDRCDAKPIIEVFLGLNTRHRREETVTFVPPRRNLKLVGA